MGSKAVAKGVRGDTFVDFGNAGGFFNRCLNGSFMNMVATEQAGLRVFGKNGGRKEILPDPFLVRVGKFFIQSVGQRDRGKAGSLILLILVSDLRNVQAQRWKDTIGKHGDAIIAAFAIIDEDAVIFEVDVFDAQAQTFHQPQTAAVHDLGHELISAAELKQDGAGFFFGKNGGNAFSFLGPNKCQGRVIQLNFQEVAVKKEDSANGLVLGRG